MAAGGCPLIARTSWVYSAFGKNFFKTMLRVGAERDELSVVHDQMGCPTHAADLATGLLRAARLLLDHPDKSGIYHLAGRDRVSWAEFAERIFEHSSKSHGSKPNIRRIDTSEYPTPAARPANSQLDSQAFVTAFGYECSPLDTGIKRTLADLASALD
jgi:dTDP-4-dehydrorhamnose reductase